MSLLDEVAATLTRAGIALAPPIGAGLKELKEIDTGVMVAWGMDGAADYRTVAIMLGAVAEVLRVHGFRVERHPVGLAYLVTGRGKVSIDDLTGPPVWETNPDGVWQDA